MNSQIFTLGCDPEYIVWDYHSHNIIGANSKFGSHDHERARDHTVLKCDGCSSTAELETPPFTTPEAGIALLKPALKQVVNMGLDFLGGCKPGGSPIGGHIHFSIQVSKDILNLLDCTLGYLSYLVEPNVQRERCIKGAYGRFSAFETKPWGFEYRTPPSWLIAEEWARAFLTIAWTDGLCYIENKKKVMTKCLTIKNDKTITWRNRVMDMLIFMREEFPHNYDDFGVIPVFRLLEGRQTWNEPKPINGSSTFKGCSQRWHL